MINLWLTQAALSEERAFHWPAGSYMRSFHLRIATKYFTRAMEINQ